MPKMIKCKTCGIEIAKSAKSCPSCGAKNKKPIYLRWWFITIVVFFLLGAIGSGGSKTKTDLTQTNASVDKQETKTETLKVEEKPKEKYEFVGEVTSSKDSFAIHIEGIIKNNSGKELNYVQVTYNLFDKDGNQLGTAIANVNNLAKDGTWKFKAMGIDTDDAVATYKLAEVTGF